MATGEGAGWRRRSHRRGAAAGLHHLLGIAGGTGHVAIQLALLEGARVAATVSSHDKARIVMDLGAELAINYREADFADEALRWSGGVNVALDNAGAEVLQKNLSLYGALWCSICNR